MSGVSAERPSVATAALGDISSKLQIGSARPSSLHLSKRLGQSGLPQDRIRCVAAGDSDRYGEVSLRDRTMPDLMAAAALPDQRAAGGPQQFPQQPIERRRHSDDRGLGFA